MGKFDLLGDWVQRRRKQLDLTQADLARRVSCSLSMLRKIERGERRPSQQLAELLSDQLSIDDSQRGSFLSLARGKYLPDLPDPIHTGVALPLPAESTESKQGQAPFVARARELLLLHQHLESAMQGQGRVVFVAGEAGRGKTSLVYEFARQALETQPDLIVAAGSSDVYTGQGDPLLPFRDIFRLLAGDLEHSGMPETFNRQLATRLARAIPVIAEILLDFGPHLIDTLVPGRLLETRLALGSLQQSKNTDILLRLQEYRARQALSATQDLLRDSLFDEISSTLNALAQRQPLMLILDDMHWVDASSAALLGHLVMRLKQSPILMLGCFRPEDLTRRPAADGELDPHPLQEVLSESLRQFGQNRIELDHFGPGEDLEFVNALLDASENDYSEAFREKLALLTEGHPLFLVELLRDMRDRGDIFQGDDGRWKTRETVSWDSFPARVEGVIEKRITRLPEDLRALLSIGSVQGETFFAEVISQVRQIDPRLLARHLSADLDQRHRLIYEQGITRLGTERVSQYRFRHHLFQKYLYERLAAAERMYLHEAVGKALEALFAGSGYENLPAAQLARHFREARLSYEASKYLLLAGQKAARVLAFAEAVVHFEHALSELKSMDRTPEITQLEYELRLAMAQSLWHSGRVKEAVTTFIEVIEFARALNHPHALAQAVLAYEQPRWRLNLDSQLSQQYLREALAALGEEQSGLKVRLLVELSRSLLASGEQDELRATVERALRIARQIDDPLALCNSLRIKAQIDRRPETTEARLAAIREMIALAEATGEQEMLADGFDLYVYDLLELGQIELVDEMIEAQRQVAQQIKQPFQLHVAAVFQTMRAILCGEFEKAEGLAREAANISQQIGIADLDGLFGMHMFTIRREQGRLKEVAPIVKLIIANKPGDSAWGPGLALLFSLLGQSQECQTLFDSLASDGFAFVPQDSLRVATLAYLSEVCAYLEDNHRAETLYELLLPYDGRAVVAGGATVCFGAAARYLGLLAKTMLDWESAQRHFQGAIELDKRLGAWPWLAHSQFEYAAMLLEWGRAGDRQPAQAWLEEALSAAQRMGMSHLAAQVVDLRSRHQLISATTCNP